MNRRKPPVAPRVDSLTETVTVPKDDRPRHRDSLYARCKEVSGHHKN